MYVCKRDWEATLQIRYAEVISSAFCEYVAALQVEVAVWKLVAGRRTGEGQTVVRVIVMPDTNNCVCRTFSGP